MDGAPDDTTRTGESELDPVDRLVARCLEAPDCERTELAARLAGEHPDLATELARRLRALAAFGLDGHATAPEPPLVGGIPEVLGDFRLGTRLGGGGMGVVYLAEQLSVARRVALKLVRPELLLFPGARERFQREVEAVGRLQHPGIVAVHTVGEASGVPFFAMEKVDGCSAAELIADLRARRAEQPSGARAADFVASRSGVPITTSGRAFFDQDWVSLCLDVAQQVAEALEHAHARGVVHRDVKPSNIMLTADGRARLIDFGVSSREGSDRDGDKMTRTGAAVGSLPYMSPEQVEGRALDARTDVYSLGVTLYELLTLQDAFYGQSYEDVRRLVLEARPRPIRSLNSRVSWEAEVVCATAMAPEPERRYASAAALARDLEAVRTHRPIAARPAGPWRRLRRVVRRNPSRAALVGVLALAVPAVTGLGGYVLASADDVQAAKQAQRRRDTDQELARGMLAGFSNAEQSRAALDHAAELSPERADVVATRVMMNGKPEVQLAMLDRYSDLVARHGSLGRAKADALERLGRNNEAAALRAELPPPSTAEDWFIEALRARHAADQGDPAAVQRALAACTRAILLAPTPQCAHYVLRAELATILADHQGIEETVAAIERHWPDSAAALALCGLALSEIDLERAEKLLDRALALEPSHARAHAILSQILLEQGRVDDAVAQAREAVRLQPDSPGPRFGLGDTLVRNGRIAEGVEVLRQALQSDKLDALSELVGRRLLATALRTSGDDDGAEAALERALEISPHDVDARLDLGKLYVDTDRLAEALPLYEGLLADVPEHATAHGDYGVALLRAGKPGEAEKHLARAVELDPDDVYPHTNYGAVLASQGKHADRRAELQRWADLHPDDAAAWNDLAWFLADPTAAPAQRDPPAALAAAERAAKLSARRNPGILDTLAWAHFHLDDFATALATENEALKAWQNLEHGDPQLRRELEDALKKFEAAGRR
ncbi:MAG: protein kinase [Planctomycetota bacterium]